MALAEALSNDPGGFALPVAAIVAGFVALVLGADRFVLGAKNIALRLGMSPLMVGMVVVGVGTSAPEMLVSAMAASDGDAPIAIGNAIGSNISNLGLVLGITALVAPIPLQPALVKREFPFLLGLMGVYALMFVDHRLDHLDGIGLLAGIGFVAWRSWRQRGDQEDVDEATLSMRASSLWFALGLALMIGGSRGIVWGAVETARGLGISELVIGLTIVAIGTSLPEIAASIAAALKREHALAVGNVLGSNVFNLLLVLPFPAFMAPGEVDPAIISRDYPVMVGMTALLVVLGFLGLRAKRLGRVGGTTLVAAYLAYATWLVLHVAQR